MTIRVAVSSHGKDLLTPMANMRDWLDTRGFQPEKFGYQTLDGQITFHLDFGTIIAATAFATAFGGQVLWDGRDRAA